MSDRGDMFRQTATDRSCPRRPTVVRHEQPDRLPWLIVFSDRGVRRELRYRSHPSAVARAHELAQMMAEARPGPFYSVEEILHEFRQVRRRARWAL